MDMTMDGMDLERMASDFLIASKRCEMDALESLLAMGGLMGPMSDLIHALQRERGASNFFLGSGGKEFGVQLEKLIGETDDALRVAAEAWEGMSDAPRERTDRARFFNRLAHAAHALAGLGELRSAVRGMKVTPREAVDAYSELVKVLLLIVFEAADAAVDPRVSRILVAMFNFMEGKEFAGQERATGAAAFATGRIDEAARHRIVRLIEEQERCFEHFGDFADDESVAMWRRCLEGADASAVEKLRRVACLENCGKELDVGLSREWFDYTTRRIDAMKGVEESLARHLQALCVEKLEVARASLRDDRSMIEMILADQERGSAGYVVYCSGRDLEGGLGAGSAEGGPRLGRSLVAMLRDQGKRLQELNEELANAKCALEDRKVIERAKGLLMKHRKINEQAAHKMLRDLAMKQNCRMAEVAARLVAMEPVWG